MTSQPVTAARSALASACAELREAGPDDAVAGVQPSFMAAPATAQEAAATMRAAAGLGLAVVPKGSGSRLSWGLPPRRCDLVIETRLLDQVVEHASGDWIATVQPGVTMERLAQVLGEAGQQLSLDAPAPAGAGAGTIGGGTIGGVLATGVAGPLRLRHGTPRDLVIGVHIIRADGTAARAGGKVVKNVAGYDLGKLFAGSYGTLGLITQATFRLHPVPAATSYVTRSCATSAQVAQAVADAAGSPLQASAIEIDRPSPGGPTQVGVLLEGHPSGVPERTDGLRDLLGGDAAAAGEPPPWWGRGAAAAGEGTLIRMTFWAGGLAAVLDAVDDAAAQAGLAAALSGSAAAGVLHIATGGPPGPVAQFVTALRAAIGQADPDRLPPVRGSVVVLTAPPPVREAVDLWGPLPGAALMRAVKDQFDPDHRMAPGRLAGGI
ncbi:MAG TPA: FAD-binding oxidoreductase [Streptosporangiaceae bacterium]